MALKRHNSITYLDQEDVINKPYVSCEDIVRLIPVTLQRARKDVAEIKKICDQNNKGYFRTKPVLVPISVVLDYYDLDTKVIRAEARKMRASM